MPDSWNRVAGLLIRADALLQIGVKIVFFESSTFTEADKRGRAAVAQPVIKYAPVDLQIIGGLLLVHKESILFYAHIIFSPCLTYPKLAYMFRFVNVVNGLANE